jgi:transcriptional regulator with XRE-family HTH domain
MSVTKVRQASVRIPAGFAGRVRRARLALNLSQAELANAIGVRPSTIKSWESCAAFWLTPAQLSALATTLQVDPDWIMTHARTK